MMMARAAPILSVLFCTAVIAAGGGGCSSSSSDADAGSSDAAADTGVPPPADAPFSCGSMTCGVTQYCVVPCCNPSVSDSGACIPAPPFCSDVGAPCSPIKGDPNYGTLDGRTFKCQCF